MSCPICGRSACALWMHSAKEQEEYGSVLDMDETAMRYEIVILRREVADLNADVKRLTTEIEKAKEDAYKTAVNGVLR